MYKYLPIILLLTACIPEIETVAIPVQINPFICVDGFKWTLQGDAIIDEFGAAIPCIAIADKQN